MGDYEAIGWVLAVNIVFVVVCCVGILVCVIAAAAKGLCKRQK